MTTNSEFLKDQLERRILSKIRNLDDCIRFDGTDTDYIFFNSTTNEVSELAIKHSNIILHKYRFFEESSKVLKTQTENRLLCVDWVEDEFIILRHLFEQSGLVNYKINKLVIEEDKDLEGYKYYELIFSDAADLAMFEVYFQKLFEHNLEKDEIEKLKKMGLLK